MKVLSFISSLDLNSGGPSRSVPMLAKGLAEVNVDITLMTIRSNNMNTHAIAGTSVKLKILEKDFTESTILSFLKFEKFDLIQIQSVWEPSYHKVIECARKLNIPYLVTPRGMLEPWSLSQKKWKKKIAWYLYQKKDMQKAACVFTTANMEAQHIRDLGINVPLSVIPNGIETEGYSCRSSKEGIKKQVLFLSRIHEKKGIELLIEAWGRLIKNFDGWNLIVVGNGESGYIESLKNLIKNKSLLDTVKISEPVFGAEKIKLYIESSVFCLPSYSENFGMVIAEAMSCGVPAITTTNCPWEILNETKTGWCIDLSVDNLELALRDAMSMDLDKLFEMGQRASKLVFDNFNYKNIALKTKALYEWILTKQSKPNFVYE